MNLYKKYRLGAFNQASVLLLIGLLSGCASMNSQFTCPMKPGQLCSSLDEVNAMVDQGKIGGQPVTNPPSSSNHPTHSVTDTETMIEPYPMTTLTLGDPLRYGESVLRIWVAPYEDQAGNYYQPSLMYTVVQPSHWISNPVQATTPTS